MGTQIGRNFLAATDRLNDWSGAAGLHLLRWCKAQRDALDSEYEAKLDALGQEELMLNG